MNRRFLLRAGVGLVALSAFAAVVVPKSAWEALMMEVSSDHDVGWQRNASGQLVATANQPPDQSYKPLIPNPPVNDPSSPQDAPSNLAIGKGDIVGTWRIQAKDRAGDLASLILVVDPSMSVTAKCEDPECGGSYQLGGMFRELIDKPERLYPSDPLSHYCEDTGPNIHLTSTAPGIYTHQSKPCVYYYYPDRDRHSPLHTYTTTWKIVVVDDSVSGTVRDSVKVDCQTMSTDDCAGYGGWDERDLAFSGVRAH